MRKRPEPRYILPETICIGDTIRVTYESADVTITRTGVVKYRDHFRNGTTIRTKAGVELITYFRSRTAEPYGAKVTLLDRADAPMTMLEGMENLV